MQSCLCVFNSLTDPPEFNSVSSDAVVVEGDPCITLECIADGEPTPNITWTKVYANGFKKTVSQNERKKKRRGGGISRQLHWNGLKNVTCSDTDA